LEEVLIHETQFIEIFFPGKYFNFKRSENMNFFLHFQGGKYYFITLIDTKSKQKWNKVNIRE